MIKLNKRLVLKVVKETVKTLYRLKSAVKTMAFNNNLKPVYHKAISKKLVFLILIYSEKK
ncbi:hypothetical protein C5471_20755 [Photorhabdus tasmaniensis]|uniref:Uncharacterized protein n=1 Tax=Photorhabdus tasmaniensis TaxID=1004159 RepID=A0ABX0GMD6_9GAMM|nr:hypothetical protein [Photorhabdus tasmaniensis]